MTRYLTGNRSTKRLITLIEPQPLRKPRRKDRNINVAAQKMKEKSKISQNSTTGFQGNEGQLCIPSTQSNDGMNKPVANSNPPARCNQSERVSSRPLKERIIHLLALRSYTIPELCDRINREGIKYWERGIMTAILKRVAFLMDDAYHLESSVWKDVQQDWPYYTEQEKAMLKIRIPQNFTSPCTNSTHSGSSPAVTTPHAPVLTCKRPGYYQGNDGIPTKRSRISRYRKTDADINNSITTNFGDARTAGGSSGGNDDNQSVTSVVSVADDSVYGRNASDTSSSCAPTSPESSKHTKCVGSPTHYTTVNSMEQRRRYKAEFNANYEEYKGLHAEAMNVWQRIADLEERLNQVRASGNRNEFKEMQQQYLLEYSRTKNDSVRIQKERRFYYLHNKLDHIRRLVLEYDMLNGIANMIPEGYCEIES